MTNVGVEGTQLLIFFSSIWIKNQMRVSGIRQMKIYQSSDSIADEGHAGGWILVRWDPWVDMTLLLVLISCPGPDSSGDQAAAVRCTEKKAASCRQAGYRQRKVKVHMCSTLSPKLTSQGGQSAGTESLGPQHSQWGVRILSPDT